jgi:D-amino-acid oxidase
VPKHQLPDGAKFGIIYTTFNFNSPRLLKFLQQHLTAQGVTFVRRRVDNLQDAFLSPSTKVLFNCTGIGARNLGGLEDPNVYPIRGQVVVVRAPNVQENRSIFDDHSITYIIPRPDSGGHVICGGFYQENDWTADTFSWATESIIERTTQLMPELRRADGTVEIIRECAGLRPARKGGARIEKELISDGRAIIHNYGAAGTGYQSGYAMALKAVSLLRDTKL